MNILYPGGIKPEWFDRNPLVRNKNWSGNNIAPHVLTTRVTYTVPTGRRVFIARYFLMLWRQAAAAPADVALIRFKFNDTVIDGTIDQIYQNNNNLNIYAFSGGGQLGWGTSGQSFIIETADLSTGGQYAYNGSFTIVEFDA